MCSASGRRMKRTLRYIVEKRDECGACANKFMYLRPAVTNADISKSLNLSICFRYILFVVHNFVSTLSKEA